MKSSVIVFPGSNCDRDIAVALEKMQFKNQMVWHKETKLPKSDLIVLPGGFSYGDYLRSGAIAGKSLIIDEVIKAANSGCLILGICNGFQILTETGLLKGTLLRNKNLKFINKDVHIKVLNNNTKFSNKYKKKGFYLYSRNSTKIIEAKNSNNKINIGIPGSYNLERRNYDELLNSFSTLNDHQCRKIKLYFIGNFSDADAKFISILKDRNIEFTYYQKFVDTKLYNQIL